MKKRLLLAIIFLAIIGGGLVGFNLWRAQFIKDIFANMQPPAKTVSTITLEPRDWTPGIEAIGTANARNGVDLTVQISGIVQEIAFKANQRVEKGEVLLKLDDSIQKADLEAAQAEAVLADQNFKRAETLRTRGVGAVSDVDTTAATASAKKAMVSKLQAVLEQKAVTAPFSGVIGIAKVDLGEYLTPGTVIATLQETDTMRIDFTVPEQMLPLLKLGQSVEAGPTSQSLNYRGTLTGIDPKIDPSTRMVSVRAEVQNDEPPLTPGQFVQVRIELPKEANVLALPQTAVVSSLYGDYVFVVRTAEPKEGQQPVAGEPEKLVVQQVFVKLGRQFGGYVEVTGGLKAGDVIVSAGQNRLTAGGPVTIDNTINSITEMGKE